VGYLITHADAYLQHPWSALDIRDGGWLAWCGFLAGAAWLAYQALKKVPMRRSIAFGALATAGIWIAANGAIGLMQGNQATAVPDVALEHLTDKPDARLPTLLAGKPAVVNIWATWCGPCRVEMPTLEAAQNQYEHVQFVFVNQGENARTIQSYLTNENLALQQVWIDPSSELLKLAGSSGLPTTLFFNSQGHQVDAHFGVLSAASLAAKVSALQ
jgi:thiol-disulfide isomerase/thioredoxin